MAKHRPSIGACAGGFGAAGMGIGSLVGLWISEHLYSLALQNSQLTPAEQEGLRKVSLLFGYAGTFTGVLLGFLAGAFSGVAYALYKRCPPAETFTAEAGK